jgi:hypothetical protein
LLLNGFIDSFGGGSNRFYTLDKIAKKEQIDMFYFAAPLFARTSLPYIFTVWDLGHRTMLYSPEVSKEDWGYREKMYNTMLPRATFIITGNNQGKSELLQYYKLDENFSGKLNRHGDSTPIVNRLNLGGNTTIGPATKKINGYSSYNWGIYSNRRNKYFYNPIVEIYNTINPVTFINPATSSGYYFGTNINSENSIRSDINTTTDSAGSKTVHYFNYYIPQSIKTGYL